MSATGAEESGAVLIRDRQHAIRAVCGTIPYLRRNMKYVATRARDDGVDDFVWDVTFARWYYGADAAVICCAG